MSGATFQALLASTGGGVIQTAFSTTLNANDGSDKNGYSFRVYPTALNGSGGPWRWVRVRFRSSTAAGTSVGHASIGIHGSGVATTATPVELLFSGVSGFSLSAGQTITSDWAVLSFSLSNNIMVIMDYNGSSLMRNLSGGGVNYYKFGTTSYSTTSPTGFSSQTYLTGVDLIEGMT